MSSGPRFRLLLLFLLCLVTPSLATVFSNSLQRCQDHCIGRNLAIPLKRNELVWENPFEKCDYQCRINACHIGCQDLDSINSTCDARCASLQAPDSCLQGCTAVSAIFLHQIQALLNHVSVSVAVDETQGIKLVWSLEEAYSIIIQEITAADIRWIVQNRGDNSSGWQWAQIDNKAFRDSLQVTSFIPLLQSASAQVRLAVEWRSNIIVSRTFVSQLTSNSKIPRSISLTSQLQLGANRYVVCWNGYPRESNSQQFKVVLTSLDSKVISTVQTKSTCYFFKNLPTENCCRATISDASIETGAPEVTVKIELAPVAASSAPSADSKLLFTNGTAILRMADINDYVMLTDPEVLKFSAPTEKNITALAAAAKDLLLVGLSDGSIFSVNTTSEESLQLREGDGVVISQIAVDPFQYSFYAIVENKGILRCALNSCKTLTTLTMNSVKSIAVDYWNGYLYYIVNAGEVFAASLFPLSTPETFALRDQHKIASLPYLGSLEIDYSKFALIGVGKNGSLIGLNLVDRTTMYDVRADRALSGEYKAVFRSKMVDDRWFWISTSCGDAEACLMSEEKDAQGGNNLHLNKYLYPSKVVDFTFASDLPLPAFLSPPDRIGVIMSAHTARVTWTHPASLPFQAPGSEWKNMTYSVRLMSDQTDVAQQPSEMTSTNGTDVYLLVNSGAQYTASVRACSAGVCSVFANAINSAFSPYEGRTPVAIYVNEEVAVVDLIGRDLADLTPYPSLPKDGVSVIAYDNSSRLLYSSTESEVSLFRSNVDGIRYRFLDYLTIKYLAVMPKKAILLVATSYSIVSYRLTSSFDQLIHICDTNECGEVVGLAADDKTGDIFYLIQARNGSVQLFGLSDQNRTAYFIASALDFPEIRQLVVVQEKLMFVTSDRRVGSCDKKLGSLNINYAVSNVLYLLPVDESPLENRFTFSGEIAMGNEHRGELSWDTQPSLSPGRVLYKVELWKDHFGGERSVDVSPNQTYFVPERILEGWPSGQNFDVQIDALTAWTIVSANRTGLSAPTKPPTAPTGVKIFATQQKTVDGARAIINLFWNEPKEWNGDHLGYVVNCTIDDAERVDNVSAKRTSFEFSVKSGKVQCAVAAVNDPSSIGSFSQPLLIDSSEVKPLVRLFAIDSTNNLISISNWSSTENARKKRQSEPIQYQAISYVGSDLYAIRKETESVQPILAMLDINDVSNVIHKVSLGGDFSQIEAMTSDWVANRLLIVANHHLMQIPLETFQTLSTVTPKKVLLLSSGAGEAKQLIFDPFTNVAYLLTKNGSLFSLDLSKGTEQNLGLGLDCIRSETVTAVMGDFGWNRASSPVIYALTWNGLITVDPISAKCTNIDVDWSKFGDKGIKSISSFSIADKLFAFVTSSELLIYDRQTVTVTPVTIINPPLKQILAASQSSQPYPDRSCFALPSSSSIKFNVTNEGRTGALVTVAEPAIPDSCHSVSFPATQFELNFKRKNSDKVKHLVSQSNQIHLENGILDKETDYDVTVSWFNRYSPINGVSEARGFRTGYGYPSAPQDASALALTPDTVEIFWNIPSIPNAPIQEIKYKITQQTSSIISSAPSAVGAQKFEKGIFAEMNSDVVTCLENPCRAKVTNLRPAMDYKFWVTAIHDSHLKSQFPEDSQATSAEALARTKDIPGTLRLDNATSEALMLRWSSLEPENPPTNVAIQYRLSGLETSWKSPSNATFDSSLKSIAIVISGLQAATTYDFRFVAEYYGSYSFGKAQSFDEHYFQSSQQGKTKAGTPSAPQKVVAFKDAEGWIVKWQEPSADGGSPVLYYAVEYRPNRTAEWEIAERGIPADKLWLRPLRFHIDPKKSEFRVRAANAEGFGSYGYSNDGDVSMREEKPTSSLGIVAVVALILVLICATMAGVLYFLNRRKLKKRQKAKMDKKIALSPMPLQFPQSPAAPIPPELQNELNNLPRVPKDCVNQTKLLGKGSFGEVYEGVACNLPQVGTKGVRVAIKTLKSGHSQDDKIKFLKEAILMNNFDHPNIVRLLGVAFDSDPNFLIIELMEGGDLLAFLRASRPRHSLPSQLSLLDLLAMMIDIGRGCAYLEMNKHVHRDLAARNCLISSRNAQLRVTKIADFGLARDIDSSEYYRIHGEDFLPLRWLAPESAHDGVFTTKSDVWAFGVLLWEILTLGKTPYEDKENLQVLQYVKSGGTLQKPLHCPEEIFNVVRETWVYEPEKRSRFSDLLPKLEALRGKREYQNDTPYPPVEASVFDLSTDSREGSNRFDKSDNSARRAGRPGFFKREKASPSPLPTQDQLDASAYSNPAFRVLSNETLSTMCDYDSVPGTGAFTNDGFLSCDYYETPVSKRSSNSTLQGSSTAPYAHSSKPRAAPPPPPQASQNGDADSSSTSSIGPAKVSTSSLPIRVPKYLLARCSVLICM
ncbi:hypothetical protein L596_027940 [Steinernema carpocapsae]|uniref:receptor protein-tyrosine kinase n=1 Tax=Steinernema carpocapsae TaxID=34508 RepID=A0A4U5LWZ6_STECR|nr:hypothetical protein L596_027940 [Steinernema carpocapsae]